MLTADDGAREDRGMAILGEHVWEVVETFLATNDLLGAVDLGFESSPEFDAIAIKPRALGAAELYLKVYGDVDLYSIFIFVAGEQRPIEIAGPMNVNVAGPLRSADEDLVVLLDQVAHGDVFDELGNDGAVKDTDVPDRRSSADLTDEAERRRWYQPWV